MIKYLNYYKLQFKLFIVLNLVVILPLLLVYLYSPYEWKNLYWLVLTFLFALKIIFYKDGPYKKEISQTMREKLLVELGRPPSKTEVVNRIEFMITARDVVIITIGVFVIFLTLFFGKL
jgi:hypothetical protein